jgi:hypothetical protein
MTVRGKNQNDMPAVPDPDFVGALCEIWFAINYAAYHLAYVRVYLQTEALQSHGDEIRQAEQAFKEATQAEVIICRAHLAAFFWQLDHVFEALRIAIKKGQKEHAELNYFWAWGKALEKIESSEIYKEVNAYRNKSHEFPGIIGSKWEDHGTGPKFVHHFLPTIADSRPRKKLTSMSNYKSILNLQRMLGCPSRPVITKRGFRAISSFLLRFLILSGENCRLN